MLIKFGKKFTSNIFFICVNEVISNIEPDAIPAEFTNMSIFIFLSKIFSTLFSFVLNSQGQIVKFE